MAAKVSLLGMMTEKEKERILAKCDGDIFGDECVLWRGTKSSGGSKGSKGNQHGRFWFRGHEVRAHRILFHNFVAEITHEKPWVLHRCDTDGRSDCLKHLYAGTAKDIS